MRTTAIIILIFYSALCGAQQLPYAAHDFSDLLINSSRIAADRDASLTLLHRTQGLAGGHKLFSSYLTGKMPLINRRNNLLALGLGYMENRYKVPGSYMDQTINASLAYGFKMKQGVELAFAMDMAIIINKVDLNDISTGSMWLPETGFNPNLASGESLDNDKLYYGKLSSSIYLRSFDRYNNDRFVLGLAIGQLNQKKVSFYDNELTSSDPELSIISGFRLAERDNIQVSGRVLINRFYDQNYVKLGIDFNYGLYRYNKLNAVEENSVNVGAYFDFSKGAQILLQYRQPKYVLGLAYAIDTNMGIDNRIYNNAVEVLLVVRNPMQPTASKRRGKINGLKRIKKKNQKKSSPKDKGTKEIETIAPEDSVIVDSVAVNKSIGLDEALVLVEKDSEEEYNSEEEQAWRTSIGLGNFNQLTFESNATQVSKDSRQVLFHLARILKEFEGSHIILVGHTDDVGTHDDNFKLSERRAASVKEELIEIGVDADQIKVKGMGEIEPISSNESDAGRRQNRRVEFIILKGGSE